jgi:hypothetical protein
MAGRPATLRVNIVTDASKATAGLDSTASKIGKLGKFAAAGAGAAGLAIAALTVSAVKSASHLQQAVGATGAIFGKFARGVERDAGAAANAVGLSKSDYLDLANVLGSQLKNAGTPLDKLAGKTKNLIGVGSDMAAVFGGSTKDAVDALSSALKGETDPIEKYGVSIKQADINTLLAERGQKKLTGTALKQAQAAAVLDLVTKQTAATHGQFAAQSNTLAEQQQRLGALWENLKASLGSGLLPVLSTVLGFFLNQLGPGISTFVAGLQSGKGGGLLGSIKAVATVIGTGLLPVARGLWTFFSKQLVPAVATLYGKYLTGLRSAFQSVAASVQRNKPLFEGLGNLAKLLGTIFTKVLLPVLGTTLKLAFITIGKVIGGVVDTVGFLYNGIAGLIRKIGELVDKIKNSKVVDLIGKVGGAIGKGASAIGSVFGGGVQASGLRAASAGVAPSGGLAPNVQLGNTYVVVRIGERELHAVVDERVDYGIGRQARRIMGRVS